MNKLKKSLIIGAGVATIGVAGITGVASASALTATTSSSTSSETSTNSLIDKLAAKFNLNKDQVKAVFDADRADHLAAMKASQTAALKADLSSGKITQAQYDYIVAAQAEIDTLMASAGSPGTQSDTVKAQIKTKIDALRAWFKAQNLKASDLGLGFGHERGLGYGRGDHGHGSDNDADDTSSTSTNK
ncbi:hypothetical protein EPN95_04065 [Patescibacteria group bacterium]|nr:MAG: hypothetical protein EPN95_04065 [Patescibacteria group bacterium]